MKENGELSLPKMDLSVTEIKGLDLHLESILSEANTTNNPETMYKMPRRESTVHPVEVVGLQLPKIGLNSVLTHIEKCLTLSPWIQKNIKKKVCCYYVGDGRDEICKCGYPKSQHTDEVIKSEEFMGQMYNKHKHIVEAPTDAFGEISFKGMGQKTAKYVRVSNETSAEVLYELMIEKWKLQPPNLLISVTGGAKNFYMKTQLKKKFHRGLIKVAETTGAWILTGGTHAGVMKHVGRAVRNYSLSSQIVVIGVATWGIIHNRQALVHPEGRFPANYYMDEQGQGQLSCLDMNHTHFLLVDDGTHGHYGVEIDLRGRLEKLISEKDLGSREGGVTIPVVCVVLEGGPGTLNTIYNSMMNRTPCVILEGSGRIADVIATVAGMPYSNITIDLITQLMKKFFPKESFSDVEIIESTKKIQDIARLPKLLTVFCIDDEKNCDLDVAILKALLKASLSSDGVVSQNRTRQLELAVAWNRADIAESEIFTEEINWKHCDLHQSMFSALIGHKAEIVRLLLENDLCISQFIQHEDTLCELYTNMPDCLFLRKLNKRAQGDGKICLRDVAAEVQRLLGSFTQPLYSPQTNRHRIEMSDNDAGLSPPYTIQLSWSEDKVPQTVCDEKRDLFLWSVVQNQKELADIAWEQCNDCIAAALAASKILKKLALEEGEDGEGASMRDLADQYEKQAIDVFRECYNADVQRAQKLLTRVSPSWGRTTCLCIALEANDKSFIAHSGVQALLTQMWFGELAVDTPHWKLLLCMFFFPLIYTGFVVFRRDEAIRKEAEKTEENKMVTGILNLMDGSRKHHIQNQPQQTTERPLNCWTRAMSLFASPQVKFYWNMLSYFGFLWLFAVVLMMDFQPVPSWRELLLYVWITSLMCEEVRQLFHFSNQFTFRKRVKTYIKDLWNILDALSILLFITGLVCRLQASGTVFYVGKVVLCIDFVIFCLRLLAIFTISRTLGPKIIIVKKMMMDLFLFMFLLSIWVVAYGVAKQGILIENEDRIGWIIRGAVYEPYLIIFGNIPASVDATQFNMDSCSMNGTDELKPKCPVLNDNKIPAFPEWLTIIMLCIYLLFANILLLNLLIAIFNYTFEEVQHNTDTVWKFQRYDLIKEYYTRPALPPPFILLSHVCLFIKRICLRCSSQQKIYCQELSQTEEGNLLSWESIMKDNYLASLKHDKSQSMEQRIQDTAEMVENMSEMMEQKQYRSFGVMEERMAQLEQQVWQSTKALQWIIDTLQSQGYKSQQDAPILACVAPSTKTEPSVSSEHEPEKTHHFYCRQQYYPGSTVKRFPVPEEKVYWEVDFSVYDPPIYNQEEIPDSALDNYRNPGGRTGIRGRGVLTSLGPNHNLDLVITRFDGSQLTFLAVWDETAGSWSFPGGPVEPGEPGESVPLPKMLKTTLGLELYKRIKAKMESGAHTKIYKGYVDDSHNTDNAWMETTATNLQWQSLVGDDNELTNEIFQWQEVSSRTPMGPHQREFLRKVAEIYDVKF